MTTIYRTKLPAKIIDKTQFVSGFIFKSEKYKIIARLWNERLINIFCSQEDFYNRQIGKTYALTFLSTNGEDWSHNLNKFNLDNSKIEDVKFLKIWEEYWKKSGIRKI